MGKSSPVPQMQRAAKSQTPTINVGQYFFPKQISNGTIIIITAGALFVLVGIPLLFTGGLSIYDIFLVIAGILLLIGGIRTILATRRSNPLDADYDAWLEKQARILLPRARRVMNLNERQMTGQVMCVHSVILPGSDLAGTYHDHIHMKRGLDGRWRCSVNFYTFFFPADRHLAIFTRDVNAMRPRDHLDPARADTNLSEEYFYADITTATISVFQDRAIIAGQECLYRVQQLSLKIANGEDVRLGAYLGAMPLNPKQADLKIALPDVHVNEIIGELRELIRFKKQRKK